MIQRNGAVYSAIQCQKHSESTGSAKTYLSTPPINTYTTRARDVRTACLEGSLMNASNQMKFTYPANTRRSTNVVLMLAQRRMCLKPSSMCCIKNIDDGGGGGTSCNICDSSIDVFL